VQYWYNAYGFSKIPCGSLNYRFPSQNNLALHI
jgi:hypothetical protein